MVRCKRPGPGAACMNQRSRRTRRRARHGVFAKCVDARPVAFRGGRLLPDGAARSVGARRRGFKASRCDFAPPACGRGRREAAGEDLFVEDSAETRNLPQLQGEPRRPSPQPSPASGRGGKETGEEEENGQWAGWGVPQKAGRSFMQISSARASARWRSASVSSGPSRASAVCAISREPAVLRASAA